MKLRNPTPAERVTQLGAKLKSLARKDWQMPTAGQFLDLLPSMESGKTFLEEYV